MNFIELFEESFSKNADKVAIIDFEGTRSTTYEELNTLSNRVAAKLRKLKCQPSEFVIINMYRRMEYIAAYLGILKAGCTVVPLEPNHPQEKMDAIKGSCNVKIIIDESFFKGIDKHPDISEPQSDKAPALLIYTSNYTEPAKGILHSVGDLSRALIRHEKVLQGVKPIVYGATSPMSNMIHILEYFEVLHLGGTIHILSEKIRKSAKETSIYYAQYGITVATMHPQILKSFKNNSRDLQLVITGSEKVSNIYYPDFEIYNAYGTAEVAGLTSIFKLDKAYENTPVGMPLHESVDMIVCDESGNKLQPNVEGEICFEGVFDVSYLEDSEQTKKTMVKRSNGKTIIHSGDMGYYDSEGVFVFLNRKDISSENPDGESISSSPFSESKAEYVAPSNVIEEGLCQGFEQILQCGKCGINDDFFALGGDSIKALELIEFVNIDDITPNKVLLGKTPRNIARLCSRQSLNIITHHDDIPEQSPLTDAQRRMYLECINNPKSTMYNIAFSCELPENIDLNKFSNAVKTVVEKHPILNVTFQRGDETPVMVYKPNEVVVNKKIVIDIDSACKHFVKPFDLEKGPLYRFAILQTPQTSCFVFDMHRLVFDGASARAFITQIADVYNDKACYSERLSLFDIANCVETNEDIDKYQEARKFFENKLSHADFDSKPVPDQVLSKAFVGAGSIRTTADEHFTVKQVTEFARSHKISENSLFLSAFAYTLAKFGGTDSSSFCTINSGRHDSRMDSSFGPFNNTLPLHYDIDENDSITSLLPLVQEDFYETANNDCISFGELANQYGVNNDVMFVYQGELFNGAEFEGCKVSMTPVDTGYSESDLDVMLIKRSNEYELIAHYNKQLYTGALIKSFTDMFLHIISEMLLKTTFNEIGLTTESNIIQLNKFNDTDSDYNEQLTIVDLFRKQASKTPDNTCLVYNNKKFSYKDVENITDKLARHLVEQGVGKEKVVAILVPRSEYILLCSLAVLKAGGAYLLLDHTEPAERLNMMIQDSSAMLLIEDPQLNYIIDSSFEGTRLTALDMDSIEDNEEIVLGSPSPNDLFTMLYTSESKGLPSGIMFEHANALTTALWIKKHYKMDHNTRATAYSSFGFDANILDMYAPIISGGELHIISDDLQLNFRVLEEYFNKNKITHTILPTQAGSQFMALKKIKTLKHMSIVGEKLTLLEANTKYTIHNLYEPTESSVVASSFKLHGKYQDIPIGKAIENLKTYVVDKKGKLLPAGAVGELWISGPHITRGYLNRPDKNYDFYGSNPFSREPKYARIYRTGDIVRFLDDGNLQFIGKHDSQTKKVENKVSQSSSMTYELLNDYPITETQKGIFFESMNNPDSTVYNIPILLKLGKSISIKKLSKSITQTFNVHPYVKTTLFADEQGDIRAKRNDDAEVIINTIECDDLPENSDIVKPFNLLNDSLYRVNIYKTKQGTYLLMDFHQIICDVTSENIMLSDIEKAYKDETLEVETFSGYEFALEDESSRDSKEYIHVKNYWWNLLSGCETDCLPQKDSLVSEAGIGSMTIESTAAAEKKIVKYCKDNNFTLNSYFNSVFAYILKLFSGCEDLSYATIYEGRDDSKFANSVTPAVRTLPVAMSLKEDMKIKDLIKNTQSQLENSMSNSLCSFYELSREYGVNSDIIFTYKGEGISYENFCGKKCKMMDVSLNAPKTPLSLNIYLQDDNFKYLAEYATNYYSEDFIKYFLETTIMVASSFANSDYLRNVKVLSNSADKIYKDLNKTKKKVPNTLFHQFVETKAVEDPDAKAISTTQGSISFDELNKAANIVANNLISNGIHREEIVGVILDRGISVAIAELAVAKTGAAFLPMLPTYPNERIEYCLSETDSPIVITSAKIKSEKPELFGSDKSYTVYTIDDLLQGKDYDNPDLKISDNQLLCCIYTESTENPKGVLIEHRNIRNFTQALWPTLKYFKNSRCKGASLAISSISSDMSIFDTYLPLLYGKTVYIANEEEIHNPMVLKDALLNNKVQNLCCTPSFINNLISMPELKDALSNLVTIILGSEVVPSSLCKTLHKINHKLQIVNEYGPTETTICCSIKELDDNENITIGKPIGNTKLYVMDKFGNVLPPYAVGELIVCEDGVSRGYVKQPVSTKSAFFDYNGHPAYHSGDLSRLTPNGEIDLCGKTNHQVKYHGFKIDLDEIEKIICDFENIIQSKVIVRNDGGEDFLAGYFISEKKIDLEKLKTHLKAQLPYRIVPTALMQLDQMPLTPNGIIDLNQLPEPKKFEHDYTSTRTPKQSLEQRLCDVFCQVLGIDRVLVNDDFFELGGTSLTALKVSMVLLSENIHVGYADILNNPSPEKLAEFIEEKK